jgi:hypothetical protein
MTSRFGDDRDPRFFGNAGKDPDARLKIVQGGVKRHLELHPEQSNLFCSHGAYVGAGGALSSSCPHCSNEVALNDRRQK